MMKNIILIVIVGVLLLLIFLYFIKNRKNNPLFAKGITLHEIGIQIDLLIQDKLEYDFFGITSNGIDCIYFVRNDSKINIEFEVMNENQKNFVEKYKEFAKKNDFEIECLTYGNKPNFANTEEAPVYRMLINADKNKAEAIGVEIQKHVFNNNESSVFVIVP